jgi:hypothetical protein
MINDLYLLRRLLDKNYKTDIDYVYMGCTHTVNVAMFLLKHTDYKITHTTCNLDYLYKNIKNYNAHWFSKNSDLVLSNCFGKAIGYDSINQCVNIKDFPVNLT